MSSSTFYFFFYAVNFDNTTLQKRYIGNAVTEEEGDPLKNRFLTGKWEEEKAPRI